jgi:hypothetical protein
MVVRIDAPAQLDWGQADRAGAKCSQRIIRALMKLPWAIFWGGITVGVLDLIDAFVFFWLRSGAQPVAILHSIAAGWLGRDAARAGGMQTAAIGLASHFMIAFIIAAIYILASRVIPVLRRRWLIFGVLYGVAAYFVMTWFVVPLSNAGNGQIAFALPVTPVMANGILIHAIGVGLPAAFFSSRIR